MELGRASSETYSDFGRNLPLPSEVAYLVNGATDTWIQDGVIGTLKNPSWGQLDLRAGDKKSFGGLGTEFFVDIFNVTNNQSAIRIQIWWPAAAAPISRSRLASSIRSGSSWGLVCRS